MKRANRPVPIQVPVEQEDTAAASFKLTDSGVWSEGGLVFSTAGCIIDKVKAPTVLKGTADTSTLQTARKQLTVLPPDDSIILQDQPADRTAACAEAPTSTDGSTSSRSLATTSTSSCDTQPPSSSTSTAAAGATTTTSSSSNTSSPSSSSNIVLADLQELAVIGSGSSGVVKKVLHRPSQQVYVLKVINMDMGNQQVRRQVTREVRALDGARHPHVVSYHQSFFAEGAVTILMEFMDGGTLWDLLQKVRVVPEQYLAELTRQMLLGLSFLHDTARICHRDVKPSNLLLSSNGQLKISDFGTSSQLSNSMSRCLSWVGTVTYMSPERIRGDSYGFNTDVWSLGLLVLECAVGRYPYPPQQPGEGGAVPAAAPPKLGFWELLEHIVVEPPPRLPTNQFSPELVDFIAQCLQKDPARRPSATQLLLHPFVASASTNKVSLSDLLKLPRQQQSSSSAGKSGGSSVRRSGSYGGARGGSGAGGVRQSGGFAGNRSSLSGLGLLNGHGSLQQHSWQSSSIMARPAPVAGARGAAKAHAAAAAATKAGAGSGTANQDSSSGSTAAVAASSTAVAASSTAASAAAVTAAGARQASKPHPSPAGGAGSAAAALAGGQGSRGIPTAAAAESAASPGSPQPTLTTSPPGARGPTVLSATAAAAAAGGGSSGPVTPAMAAAAAAALRESSPLLSGQLLRQSSMGASMLSRQGGNTAAGSRGGLLQQPLRQAAQQIPVRQSVQQHQQHMRQHQQEACGPLQQQQHWLTSLAAQQGQQQVAARQQAVAQGSTLTPRQQQQQHLVSQQHTQGPLAQQLLQHQHHHHHQHLQQQRSKSESPHGSSSSRGSTAGTSAAGAAADWQGASSVCNRHLTPEKQPPGTGSSHGSPVPQLGQGPLTALKPSTTRRLHDAAAPL